MTSLVKPNSQINSRTCTGRIEIGNQVVYFKDTNDSVEFRGEGELLSYEITFIALVNELMKRVRRCKDISISVEEYKQTIDKDNNRIVKCIWLSTGYLRVEKTIPTRRYQHSDTVEEALSRAQGFTAPINIVEELQKNHNPRKK